MERRAFLKTVAATGAAAAVPASLAVAARPVAAALPAGDHPAPGGRFPSGVVSGDPTAESVVIWTRVRPPAPGEDVAVSWEVAADPDFTSIAATGSATAKAASDHAVKVAVSGLDPNMWWYYRFSAGGVRSPVGRSRTAPAPGTMPDRVRIGFASCQNYTDGVYEAWRAMAAEDLDLVLFLGDYIYEGAGSGVRTDLVGKSVNLAAYRRKYRMYRADPNLQAAHANFPFVSVWDDHEVHNNYAGTTVDKARQRDAYQAWFENMPVVARDDEPTRIYRGLRWGDLVEFFMLDTRQYRDPEAPLGNNAVWPSSQQAMPGRTILGDAQRSWLKDGLTGSSALWRVVGNQVMILPWRPIDMDDAQWRRLQPGLPPNAGFYLNGDSWDGYQHERRGLLEHIQAQGTDNVVFLTGDVHSFWAGDVRADFDKPASAPAATEFVGGSISSSFISEFPDLVTEIQRLLKRLLKEVSYLDLTHNGYGIADITAERMDVSFTFVDAAAFESEPKVAATFRVAAGTNHAERLT